MLTGSNRLNPVYRAVKYALVAQLPFKAFMMSANIPLNASQVPFIEPDPDGLKLLFTAASSPEAELLRQVLIEAGFHIEFVPSTVTGVFGLTGNTCIYVPAGEYAEAQAFLRDYYSAPQENGAPATDDKDPA